jgi:hypothetical protein
MTLVTFQIRRDTAANWTSDDPVLALGEPALETDTGKQKIGDGATAWSSLKYATDIANLPNSVVSGAQDELVQAKGDMIVGASNGVRARLPVGTDGYVLTARSSATDGVDWEVGGPPSGAAGGKLSGSYPNPGLNAASTDLSDSATLARLASPAFTGTPTAPTAAALDDSTKIATTGYADSAVAVERTRALAAEATLIPLTQRAAASGVATLDATARLPAAQNTSLTWASGVNYLKGQFVLVNGLLYAAQSAFTSGSTFGADGTNWALVARGSTLTPDQFGAVGDGVMFSDGAIQAGSNVLTTSKASQAKIGQYIYVRGAGASTSLGTTSAQITSGTNPTTISRTSGAAIPLSGAWVIVSSGANGIPFALVSAAASNGNITVNHLGNVPVTLPSGSAVTTMGAGLFAQITGVPGNGASAGTVTLSVNASTTISTNCNGWFSTDDAAALLNLSAACGAGYKAQFANKLYGVGANGGTFSTSQGGYALIPLPESPNIALDWDMPPGAGILALCPGPGYSSSFGVPSVIGGATMPYPSDLSAFPISCAFHFNNLTVWMPENANMGGVDLALCVEAVPSGHNNVHTAGLASGGTYGTEGILPTNNCNFAWRMPYGDNNGTSRAYNVDFDGTVVGIVLGANCTWTGNAFGVGAIYSFQDPNGGAGQVGITIPYITANSYQYVYSGWDPVNGLKSFASIGSNPPISVRGTHFLEDGFWAWAPVTNPVLDANNTIGGELIIERLGGLGYITAINITGGSKMRIRAADPTVNTNGLEYQVLTSNGTITKPGGAKSAYVYEIGSGCGGTSGSCAATSTAASGGAGGGAGGYSVGEFLASDLTATIAGTVGTSGTGGASVTSGAGNAPKYGNPTSFGSYLTAAGGSGTTSQGGGTTMFGPAGQAAGAAGASPTAFQAEWSMTGAGAAGGGCTSANAATAGGNGGSGSGGALAQASGGSGAVGAGGASTAATNSAMGGSGGGGGGGGLTGGFAGGSGGSYGGGGGGGGGTRTGQSSGVGGNGGNGVLVVIWTF